MDVAAEFAALVAKAASEKSSPPPPPVVPQTAHSAYVESSQVMTTNGPDSSDTNSIPAPECMSPGSILTPGETLPVSKQQIVDVEESSNITRVAPPTISPVTGTPPAWKQGQLSHLTSGSLSSKPSGSNSKSDVSNQAVSDEKVRPAKLEVEQQVVDFVPSVSAAELKISPTPVVVVKDLESTPVVSAQTNAPTVELVHSTRETFPALKPTAPLHQSPRRKQPQRPEVASIVPQATTVASISSVQSTLPPVVAASRDTSAAEAKVSKKPASTEDLTPPSSAFPVPQPPKEKRDQDKPHGREREKSSVTSQGRGEREKSASSLSSQSSQHHGRDREKSSRDKDKASTAPQGVPKDRDKSASRGRDRDKSSTKEAITSPSPVVPVTPTVAPAASQPQPEQPPSARAAGTAEETQQQTNGEVAAAEVTEGEYMFIVKFASGKGLEIVSCDV